MRISLAFYAGRRLATAASFTPRLPSPYDMDDMDAPTLADGSQIEGAARALPYYGRLFLCR
jgi:hypothetical protein